MTTQRDSRRSFSTPGMALVILAAIQLAAWPIPAMGAKGGNGGGGGGGGSTPNWMELGITLDDASGQAIRSDGLGEYREKEDGVLAGQIEDSAGGCRFDTDGTMKIESRKQVRAVDIDLSAVDFSGVPGDLVPDLGSGSLQGLRGVDARFFFGGPGGGLVLKDLAVDESGQVVYHFDFGSDNAERYRLNYGRAMPPDGVGDASMVTVTRTAANEWVLEGTEARLMKKLDHGWADVLETVNVPLRMTLRELP